LRTFFHSCRADLDPKQLLDPEQQRADPRAKRERDACDKCAGAGEVLHVCRSCLEAGATADCPSCQGRVRFRETCPVCLGEGRIGRTGRRGVPVFPTREGLYRYLAERNADLANRLIVEIEGELAEEPDIDADAGALLIHPEEIVEVRPLDAERVARIRSRL
jgi:RecJ-like exonuclease